MKAILQFPFSLFDKKPELMARLSHTGKDELLKLFGLYSVDCPSDEVKRWRTQLEAPIVSGSLLPKEPQTKPKPIGDFSSLIALAVSLGIATISLLIDRVNEFAPAAYDPVGAPFVCVEPVISHLRLMERLHVSGIGGNLLPLVFNEKIVQRTGRKGGEAR